MRITKWVQDNSVELWFAVGLLCLVVALVTLVVATFAGVIDPATGRDLRP